jgi:hypothetical protein
MPEDIFGCHQEARDAGKHYIVQGKNLSHKE